MKFSKVLQQIRHWRVGSVQADIAERGADPPEGGFTRRLRARSGGLGPASVTQQKTGPSPTSVLARS
jgi:hypothetical protein